MPSRAVSFRGAEVDLAGEIHVPEGVRPTAAVVLLHGAGWAERRFYRAHVDRFTAAGVACLAFDRRGEGESSGARDMDLALLAADAAAAWAFLRAQPETNGLGVGFWGYSNGAWVACQAAALTPDAAFLVLTGASGVSPAAAEVYRRTEDLRAQGIAAPTLEAVERAWTLIFEALSAPSWNSDWDAELAALRTVIEGDAELQALPVAPFVRERPELDSVPRFGGPLLSNLRPLAGSRPDMAFDPLTSLARVHCPVLAVLAEHDANVPTALSAERFQAYARSRPEGTVTVTVVPGAGHEFGPPGAPPLPLDEPRSPAGFLAGYVDSMGSWMARAGR